jgi:hypothetical protein
VTLKSVRFVCTNFSGATLIVYKQSNVFALRIDISVIIQPQLFPSRNHRIKLYDLIIFWNQKTALVAFHHYESIYGAITKIAVISNNWIKQYISEHTINCC